MNAGAAPAAVPRSALPRVAWPAVVAPADAGVLALLFQLEHSQWWPREHFARRQFEQLARLLAHAWREVPFHRARLPEWVGREALTAERLRSLPLMTRRDLQQAGSALQARTLPPGHAPLQTLTTSGSTGAPVEVPGTAVTRQFYAALSLRDHLWHGRDFAGTLCSIRVLRSGPPPGARTAWAAVYPTGPSLQLDVFRPIGEQLAWLAQAQAQYLLSYPSNLGLLAAGLRERNLALPALRQVCSFGETLDAGQCAAIAAAFGVPVVDLYSAVEVGPIALQCPQHAHYHVQAERLYLEVLDEAGQPCPPGEPGRVVITDLHNFALPLIRYEIGDLAVPGAACACGRTLPVLARIIGRVRDALRMPDGTRRWPGIVISELQRHAPIRQLQLVQRRAGALLVRIAAARPITSGQEQTMRALLAAHLGEGFAVEFEYLAQIPRAAGGKYHDFLNEID